MYKTPVKYYKGPTPSYHTHVGISPWVKCSTRRTLKWPELSVSQATNTWRCSVQPVPLITTRQSQLIQNKINWTFYNKIWFEKASSCSACGGGGFFLLGKILGEYWTIHFPRVCVCFKMPISSHTRIPLFRPGSVHSVSASVMYVIRPLINSPSNWIKVST